MVAVQRCMEWVLIKKEDALVIGRDFNTKAKLEVSETENQFVVGKYAKDKINGNGDLVIKFCKLNNLLVTIAIFKHKSFQHTTRTSPLPPNFPCNNSCWNQIDYILLKKQKTKYLTE